MKKALLWIIVILAVGFLVMQIFRPDRTNPASDPTKSLQAVTKLDSKVGQLLRKSCFDCHSNETVWPWYTNVAPSSWLVAYDVKEGRGKLNFSAWGTYDSDLRDQRLDEIREQVGTGEMPIKPYLLMHPDARLSDAGRKTIVDWTGAEQERMKSESP